MNGTDWDVVWGPKSDAWGPWGPWVLMFEIGDHLAQYRIRWVTTTRTKTTRRYFARCREVEISPGTYAWSDTRTFLDQETQDVSYQWPVFEFRTIRDKRTHGEPGEQVIVLPAMHAGDRFSFDLRVPTETASGPGETDATLEVEAKGPRLVLDGEDLAGRGRLTGRDLGIGHHYLNFIGEHEGRSYEVHAAFSVVHVFEARFVDPVRELEVDLAAGPIGQQFTLEISNNTDAEIEVYPRAHSMPAGWKVLFDGDSPSLSIEPWGTAKVELVAELMNDTGLREALVPITVEVGDGTGRVATRVFATAYVQLGLADTAKALLDVNEAIRRGHRVKRFETGRIAGG